MMSFSDLESSYFLVPTEPLALFRPVTVRLLRNVVVGNRDDFVWAETDLVIPGASFDQVLLASRHYGFEVGKSSQLPIDVYICTIKDSELRGAQYLEPFDISICCWALLMPPGDKRTNVAEIYESLEKTRGNVHYIRPVNQ
jgi:hypothetical protein